jgi:hypothetical protein
MKLIDGDKLEKHLDYLIGQDTKFAKMCSGNDEFSRQRKYCFESNILSYELCKNVIDYYLVTDVQPIERGHWIIIDDTEQFIAKCSVCGRTEDSRCIDDMPYCHCGARMYGDVE